METTASSKPAQRLHPTRLASRVIPIRDADGKIIQWFGTNTDITESRQVEKALRKSEKGYRELLDALPVAVYTTDAEGTIALYNEAATDFAGRRTAFGAREN